MRKYKIIAISLFAFMATASELWSMGADNEISVLETTVDTTIISEAVDTTNNNLTRDEIINQRRKERGLVQIENKFVPKGQWIVGLSAAYSAHKNDNYSLLMIDGVKSYGYTLKLSPILAYAVSPNSAVGGRFVYGRNLIKIDNANLEFGDPDDGGINLALKEYYLLNQSYSAMALWRQYIPLGKSKRFALFNEIQLEAGYSQLKNTFDTPTKGTYSTSHNYSLGLAPGMVAFATNNVAFEVNVGVLGLSYSKVDQIHNQVQQGTVKNSMFNFKVNLLSIWLGVVFYL